MCSDLSGDAPLDEDRQPGTGAGARALPDLLKENKKQLLTPSSCHEAISGTRALPDLLSEKNSC